MFSAFFDQFRIFLKFFEFFKKKGLTNNQLHGIISLVLSETTLRCADVAQLAEQLTCNQQVIGSSPIIGLKI